jgi:hypothetical protein
MSVMEAIGAARLPRAVSTTSIVIAGALAAAGYGAALVTHPFEAALVLALIPLSAVLGARPAATLAALLFVTVLVPFDTLNQYSLGGGAGIPGLLPVDLLLGIGLGRLLFLTAKHRPRATTPVVVALALLAAAVAALLHGVLAGAAASDAGTEARCLIVGIGAFLLAWPVLQDPQARSRLIGALLGLGLALGLWGLSQVLFHVSYGSGGDVGVRPGIDQVAAVGGGQLQGGLYAYPVAVALSFAALLARAGKPLVIRLLIASVFILNAICMLLTYERSIWGAGLIGCAVVAVRSGRASWPATARWLAVGSLVILAYAAASPGAVSTAVNRIQSVSTFQDQSSYQSRQVESEALLNQIRHHPVTGSGYGATFTWGKRHVFATHTTNFAHEGYLWLAWKLGLPFALAVVACLLYAALRRTKPAADPAFRALRVGSHGALLGSLAVCVTFPEFDALGITGVLGLLAAACLAPAVSAGGSSAAALRRRFAAGPIPAPSS